MLALFRDDKARANFYQAAALIALVGLVVWFVWTAVHNLRQLGITSGFTFLTRATGWDVSFSVLAYSINDPYWWVLLVGFLNTLMLGLIGIAVATVLGTLIAVARLSRNLILTGFGTVYVETFRNLPLILQCFFWYAVVTHFPPPRAAHSIGDVVFLTSRGLYVPALAVPGDWLLLWLLTALALAVAIGLVALGAYILMARPDPAAPFLTLPKLQGLNFAGGLRLVPEFAAMAIAIVIYGSAYIAEIVRGGFLSVPTGQLEAARALGLRPFAVYWKVRIPLALRAIMPPLGNQYVFLMKSTTIGIAIGFSDLFMVTSTSINQSGQTIELLFLMMAGFLLINYAISSLMNLINRVYALKGFEVRNRIETTTGGH
jgi:His/Glu/Gln/Arg/opine family amino acid ABC transporter permease subunit